ncbi:MAG: hypothetical protein LUG56_03345, partial [Lachnospiraceae bacterium]|nr:hypothetical protein [Lachnospiraceae bacterium]
MQFVHVVRCRYQKRGHLAQLFGKNRMVSFRKGVRNHRISNGGRNMKLRKMAIAMSAVMALGAIAVPAAAEE